jgi:hypothetical protein
MNAIMERWVGTVYADLTVTRSDRLGGLLYEYFQVA